MAAILRVHQKLRLQNRYIIEITIHEVPFSEKYPHGLKYGLICIDETNKSRILFDNHHPKGPHIHMGDEEIPYEFITEEKLAKDFRELVLKRMGIKI